MWYPGNKNTILKGMYVISNYPVWSTQDSVHRRKLVGERQGHVEAVLQELARGRSIAPAGERIHVVEELYPASQFLNFQLRDHHFFTWFVYHLRPHNTQCLNMKFLFITVFLSLM